MLFSLQFIVLFTTPAKQVDFQDKLNYLGLR